MAGHQVGIHVDVDADTLRDWCKNQAAIDAGRRSGGAPLMRRKSLKSKLRCAG